MKSLKIIEKVQKKTTACRHAVVAILKRQVRG
jgi:hypothetical protein